MSAAEKCRQNQWAVGTRIVGVELSKPTVLRITAVGQEFVLAVSAKPNRHGVWVAAPEKLWNLDVRDWQLYEGEVHP